MKAARSPDRVHFECRDCGNRVNPASYRAECPTCEGALRSSARPAGGQ